MISILNSGVYLKNLSILCICVCTCTCVCMYVYTFYLLTFRSMCKRFVFANKYILNIPLRLTPKSDIKWSAKRVNDFPNYKLFLRESSGTTLDVSHFSSLFNFWIKVGQNILLIISPLWTWSTIYPLWSQFTVNCQPGNNRWSGGCLIIAYGYQSKKKKNASSPNGHVSIKELTALKTA